MAEIDSVMSQRATSAPLSTVAMSSANTSSTNVDSNTALLISNNGQQIKDNQNGDTNKKNIVNNSEAMEVDGGDTEEDDSQLTSSTENGGGVVDGDDSKMSEYASKVTPHTSVEGSKESHDRDSGEPLKSAAASSVNENSSNACDGISPNTFNEKPEDESQDSVASLSKTVSDPTIAVDSKVKNSVEGGGDTREKKPAKETANSDTEFEDELSLLNAANMPNNNDEETPLYVKSTKSNDSTVNKLDLMDTTEDPLRSIAEPLQKENGIANSAEKIQNDVTGIVDLGDDSDEEIEVPKKDTTSNGGGNSLKSMPLVGENANKSTRSICSDSDGAVVIGSDSENETSDGLSPVISKPKIGDQICNLKANTQIIDDDDDDCVVIEDDTPTPVASDLSKRSSMAMDSPNHSDDSQPPSKRLCSIAPANVSQITIKDARSLMPQEVAAVAVAAAAAAASKKVADNSGSIYPVNITPAQNLGSQGPPKLVPMGTPTNAMPLTGLSGLSSNANLLPGLTDDMFVLEAPSFIVPYIYEKPPADNLKEVVKEIEAKYKLTKDDLSDADKVDGFDMMTEQNKEDKDEKSSKKKKKRRGGDDPDESWSEESEVDDDEDDDDSESGMRTKVLIKEASDDLTALKVAIKPAAAVVPASGAAVADLAAKPGQENFFESPLGKFFMDIGVGLVQEFVQSDLIRLQKRKMRKSLGKNITEFERAITALSGNLEASKKKNSPFKFTMKRCEFCNFKSESALAMANHYETPHMNGPLYKCNFCIFEIRNATEIVYHMEAVHNIKARLIKPLPYHQCPNCGFEDNGKAKMARHQPVCVKKFRPELNLAPPNDWEAPAKIPRIKPRHGLVGTATAYQAMAAQAAAQKAALASIQQQQQQVVQARNLQAALAAQNAANKIRGRSPQMPKPGVGPNGGAMLRGPTQVRSPMATNVVLPNNYQLAGGQLLQTANAMAKKTLSGQPSISITPLPRQSASPQASSSPSTSKMQQAGIKPGQSPGGNKAQFVICEICDGYIKDLEQLRNHMQWMHKVKIHPKMIYNRPPLNCQKCQFRFFTDQGLERHLLGSHGLVTSSMQEAANKGKDAGRCPVCGRMYQWKLLNHVSRDHHMTLKPAHLSYKCTVCTATFGMYKQFETHVYTAHSTVAKKAMDGKKNNTATGGSGASSSGIQRTSLSATNDSLLKPLKINDEITIIPQPSSKSRITNMESHVID